MPLNCSRRIRAARLLATLGTSAAQADRMRIAPLLLSSLIVLAATGTAHAGGYMLAYLSAALAAALLLFDDRELN